MIYIFFKQSYESSVKENLTTNYPCNVPQGVNGNSTHLVDHDYTETRYFDIFNETTDENMQEGLWRSFSPF